MRKNPKQEANTKGHMKMIEWIETTVIQAKQMSFKKCPSDANRTQHKL